MPLARPLRFALALALLPIAASSAHAAWIPQGNPVCAAGGTQQQVSGCPDGNGGAYLVWGDMRSAAAQIYAQHLFGDGSVAPGWPAGGLQLTSSLLAQFPTALPDGAGGLLVISQVGSDLVALRVDASGALAPGFPAGGIVLTSDLTNTKFAAASDGAGGAWVLRQGDAAANGTSRIRLTRVTRDGAIAPGWTVNGVTLLSGNQFVDALHLDADFAGGAVATVYYTSNSGGSTSGVLARVRANGVVVLNQGVPVSLPNSVLMEDPIAVADGRAGLLAVWAEEPSPGPELGVGAHWDSTGAALWPAPTTLGRTYFPTPFRAAADGNGGAYLVVCDVNSTPSPLVLRRTAGGSIAPGWSAPGVSMGGALLPEIALLATPAGPLTFWSTTTDASSDLRAMLLNPNGSPASGWDVGGEFICSMPGKQSSPVLIADGLGGVIGCWLDLRNEATTGQDVYATRLVASQSPVATDAALVEARAEADRVLLEWWSAEGPQFAAALEREAGGAGWSPLAEVRADASGTIRYEDRDVETGATYGYRLVVTGNGERRVLGQTTLTVPAAASFALEPVRPNPAGRTFALAFTLPDTRPARIEIVDLTGRLVRSETFDPGRAGRFVLRRALAGAPGVYLVRLSQGGVSRTTRLVHAE